MATFQLFFQVKWGIVVQGQNHRGDLPRCFTFEMCFNCTSRDKQFSALIVWPFGRLSMRRMPSWSQKIEARKFPGDFCARNFWSGVSRYTTTPFIVALSPGHSDITRFRPWSPIGTGNHMDLDEKFQILLRRLAPLKFLFRLLEIRDPLRGDLPHVQIFMNGGTNPLTWDALLLSYRFSRNPAVFQH